jgi:adenine-specific DNA-methyltransferase
MADSQLRGFGSETLARADVRPGCLASSPQSHHSILRRSRWFEPPSRFTCDRALAHAYSATADADVSLPRMADGTAYQTELPLGLIGEAPEYLTSQLVTYIGNKRAMLEPIRRAVEEVQRRTGRSKLRILDAFSGSGVVARMFKQYASELIVNDFEDYARCVSACYLTNRSEVSREALATRAEALNRAVSSERAPAGFFRRLYSPRDPSAIVVEDRVFYTPENAYRLDAYRQLFEAEDAQVKTLLMGPLLSEASIHANTAGVFKGFYKDRQTGIGKFGGSGADALDRITAPIVLEPPILSNFECDYAVHQADANALVHKLRGLDVAYFDPPYNQHPYGSNYFMLNLLVSYQEPAEISRVSGIPNTWRRSDYNVRSRALPRLRDLIESVDARFVILSFNDEGFVSPGEIRAVLNSVGTITEHRQAYTTFRGCRNLRNRSNSVTEHVYLVEKD